MSVNLLNVCPSVRTILLVEDDIDDQEFIREAFLSIDSSLTVHTVSNGNAALNYLQSLTDSQLPQLILLDYNLPQLDGSEVLQTLTEYSRYHTIPKIVWSTSDSPQYKMRCLRFGATSYIVKPSFIADIKNIARQMLELCQVAV